jgi:hypothetical protein
MTLKYFENQVYPIPHLEFEFSFFDFLNNRIDLSRLQYITNYEGISLEDFSELKDFFEFPLSNIGRVIRFISFLESL